MVGQAVAPLVEVGVQLCSAAAAGPGGGCALDRGDQIGAPGLSGPVACPHGLRGVGEGLVRQVVGRIGFEGIPARARHRGGVVAAVELRESRLCLTLCDSGRVLVSGTAVADELRQNTIGHVSDSGRLAGTHLRRFRSFVEVGGYGRAAMDHRDQSSDVSRTVATKEALW